MNRCSLLGRIVPATQNWLACGALALSSVSVTLTAAADDWAQWRGPNREGRSTESGLMQAWPEGGPAQLWTNTATGLGYGGIAVVQGQLFTVGAFEDQEFLLALDANSGKEQWRAELGTLFVNNWGDGPRSTPTVVDGRVFALGAQGNLVCVDQNSGSEIWRANLTDFGGSVPTWGYSESPLVDENYVVVTPGGPNGGAIVALDKSTGKLAWQSDSCQGTAHYSSVIVAHPHGKKQYVQLLMERLVGLDPSTGQQLWSVDWPGRVAVIPTPIADGNRVYISSGYGVGCMMVEIAADNSVTEVYRNKVMKNHHGGVIKVGDHLYGYSDGPGWTCQDFASGESLWEEGALGKGCLTFAGGRLIMQSEDRGEIVLVEPSDAGWRERGRFVLSPQSEQRKRDGRIWTHPVVSGGKLYLKDQEILYCYDVAE